MTYGSLNEPLPVTIVASFAKNASIEGMVVTLEGITQILDTDIRSLLEQIQPADRTQSMPYTKR